MARGMSIKVTGTQAAKLKMAGIAEKAARAMYEAATGEAEIVEARAKKRAPVLTGRLRDSIKTTGGSGSKGFRLIVGPDPGKSRDDLSGAWYAGFVERGTSRMPAHPFMKPAFRHRKRFIRKGLRDALNKALED